MGMYSADFAGRKLRSKSLLSFIFSVGNHYGIDRTLYYDVYCGGKKLIGMNDWRLEEFLGRVDEGILPSLPGSVKPLVKKEPERRRAELPKSARKLKKGGPHL